MSKSAEDKDFSTEEVTDKILTVPNVISLARLILVPFFVLFLTKDQRIVALVLFCIAAATDFVDGQVARRTHSVSKLGKLLDPAIDTILMLTGVLAVVALGELPVWFAVLIILREVFMLIGGAVLIATHDIRIAVIYPGKFATTFLFIGFAGMILGAPCMQGFGLCDISWLPGFNSEYVTIWVWFIYVGLALQIGVTIYYCVVAFKKLKEVPHTKGLT